MINCALTRQQRRLVISNIKYRDNFVVSNDTEAEATYLSLDELGVVLGKLNQQLPGSTVKSVASILLYLLYFMLLTIASLNRKRTFNDELKPGCPNLIVMPPCKFV